MLRPAIFSALVAVPAAAFAAGADVLAPYKDDLFRNHVVETLYDGDYIAVEFSKDRDLYGRDAVVEKKAFPKFVSLAPNKVEKDLALEMAGKAPVRYVAVGKNDGGAKFVVIFLHGDAGSRFQAMDDWTFGGNFNRLKNLATLNGGLYLSPDFADFGKKGADQVKALMQAAAAKSPGAPIIVACTSRSGQLCFRLVDDAAAAKLLGGIILLGAGSEDSFFETKAFSDPAQRIPIFIGHGSNDKIIPWVKQDVFFKKVKAAVPGYPIRLALYVNGAHGTPMRMVNWRGVLNWMLAENSGSIGKAQAAPPAAQ